MSFVQRLLDETGVAVAPGVDFDPGRGATYLRLSFAGRKDDLADGIDRIASWLRT